MTPDSQTRDDWRIGPRTELARLITQATRAGSLLVLGTERIQNFLFTVKLSMESGQIPRVPVYDDSPIAIRAMESFLAAFKQLSGRDRAILSKCGPPFSWPGFTYATTHELSSLIIQFRGSCIIVSSGMGVRASRMQEHLACRLPDPRNFVLILGTQPKTSIGAKLRAGDSEVLIFGDWVPVRAQVFEFDQSREEMETPELNLFEETARIISPDQFRRSQITIGTDIRLIKYLDEHPARMLQLGPRQFEELVKDLLVSEFDYDVVQQGPLGRDGGIDIYAERDAAGGRELTVIQCKRNKASNKVGEPIVKQFLTDVNESDASRGLIVTTSSFSTNALKYMAVREYKLAGADYLKLQEWIHKMRGKLS